MEPVYKYFKPAWKSFYKLIFLMLLVLILACAGSFWGPFTSGLKLKVMWILAIVVELVIFFYIFVKRLTMSLILKDNPDKAEDQEIAFVVCHPLKPFSSDFRESIEIGLANIVHVKVGQNLLQTLLNIGDIAITSSGTSGEEIHAKNIPSPNAVRDEIQAHARKYTQPNLGSNASAPVNE